MLVRCNKRFRDLKAGTLREEGSVFEVDDKRLDELNSTRYGTLVSVIEQEAPVVEDEKPRRKRPTRRKATGDTE